MKNQANILVIEDDKEFRETLIKALKKEGYVVESAADGESALKLAEKNKFDMLISDVRLPGGNDGVDITKEIKGLYPDQEPVVIIITGYASEDVPIKAIKVKVDDYITKPFNLPDFLSSIKKKLEDLKIAREDKSLIKDKKEAQRKHDEWGKEDIDLKNDLCELIADILYVNEIDIKGESNFRGDLGADSIDISELIVGMEDKFGIEINEEDANKIETVQEAFDYIKTKKSS